MLNEQISDELVPKFCSSLLADFKYKKLAIDKKLDEIINKKFIEIEKAAKKNKNASIYFQNGYVGETNKEGMPHGIGNLLFSKTEDMYNGEFKHGLKHGIGKYTYLSGGGSKHHPFSIPYYIGEWFADSYHGLGKHYITEFEFLCIYEGTHTHDKQNGFGTYKKFNKGSTEEDCKICNTELIGYFAGGQGLLFMIEINRDDKGNLAKDVPSGLLEYDLENGSKQPLSTFNEISDWDKIKPEVMKKDISGIVKPFYDTYLTLDPFTDKFTDLILKIKKKIMSLMFNSNEYFVKNAKDEKYNNFLTKVNALNKVINQLGECDKLVELDEKIEEANKEFAKLEKNLKK